MNKAQKRDEIKNSLVTSLENTGNYSYIDTDVTFGDRLVDKHKRAFVLAEKNPEFYGMEPKKYLFTCITSESDFTMMNLETLINFGKSEKISMTSIFSKGKKSAFFRWDGGIFKPSRERNHTDDERIRMINLRDYERYSMMCNDGILNYFDHGRKVFESWNANNDVNANYDHNDYVPEDKKDTRLVRSKICEKIFEGTYIDFFTHRFDMYGFHSSINKHIDSACMYPLNMDIMEMPIIGEKYKKSLKRLREKYTNKDPEIMAEILMEYARLGIDIN